MAEWYIYALGVFAGGLGLLVVYIILKQQKIIGSIPILSGIVDPILSASFYRVKMYEKASKETLENMSEQDLQKRLNKYESRRRRNSKRTDMTGSERERMMKQNRLLSSEIRKMKRVLDNKETGQKRRAVPMNLTSKGRMAYKHISDISDEDGEHILNTIEYSDRDIETKTYKAMEKQGITPHRVLDQESGRTEFNDDTGKIRDWMYVSGTDKSGNENLYEVEFTIDTIENGEVSIDRIKEE